LIYTWEDIVEHISTLWLEITMAPIKLPCPDDECGWKTVELEMADAKELLVMHIMVMHTPAPQHGAQQHHAHTSTIHNSYCFRNITMY
jgi:hypothetical protein